MARGEKSALKQGQRPRGINILVNTAADFGLLYYNARWYDPTIGRFAQADTIVPAGVQGYDRYAYVQNNPLRYTDPSGHCATGDGDIGCGPNGSGNSGGHGNPCNSQKRCGFTGLPSKPNNGPCVYVMCLPTSTPQPTPPFILNPVTSFTCTGVCACAIGLACISEPPAILPSPAVTPQPTSEFWQLAKDELKPSIDTILGKPGTVPPGFSQAIVDSLNGVQLYITVTGQWVVSNGPGVADYLYNPVLPYIAVKTIVNGWMGLTNNNPLILPLPMPYLMNNPSLPPQYQFGPPQYQ